MANTPSSQTDCPTNSALAEWLDAGVDASGLLALHVEGCDQCQLVLEELTNVSAIEALPQTGLNDLGSPALQAAMDAAKSHGALLQQRLALPGDITPFPGQPTADAPLGTIERYDVIRRIGEGASGVLYEAFDRQLERAVALKVLRCLASQAPDAHKRLTREAKAIAALRHPAVVTVFEVIDRDDFPPVLVMDLWSGGSVSDLLRQSGRLSPERAACMTIQAASGIDAAHSAGLIHRDIKPSNLLVGERDRVLVADFGLVRDSQSDSDLTLTSDITGTPAYMSPEQVRDPSGVDRRTDIYSLGCVLYELLTGRPPFEGSVRRVLWQIDNELPRPPRDLDDTIPLKLQNICLKALAKRPADRYQLASDFSADLSRFIAGQEVIARSPSIRQRLSLSWRKHPAKWAWSAAGIFTLLSITAATTYSTIRLKAARDFERVQSIRERAGRDMAISAVDAMALEVYDNLDNMYVDLDELQIDILKKARDALQRIDAEGGDVGDRHAAALLRLGRSYWRLDEMENAREHLELADAEFGKLPSEVAKRISSRILKVEIDAALARLDYDQGLPRATKKLAQVSERAIELLNKNGEDESVRDLAITVTMDLAYSIEDGRNPEKAIAHYKTAQELHQAFGPIAELDWPKQTERLALISDYADLLYNIDIRSETLIQYQRLLDSVKEIEAATNEPESDLDYATDLSSYSLDALSGLGLAHADLKQWDECFGSFDQAIELAAAATIQMPSDFSAHDTLLTTLISAAEAAQEASRAKQELMYSRAIVHQSDQWRSMAPDDADRIHNCIQFRKDLRDVLRELEDPETASVSKEIKALQSLLRG